MYQGLSKNFELLIEPPMTTIIRFADTAMFYRGYGNREHFVRGRGWVLSGDIRIGDWVSRYTDPPLYHQVTAIEDEADG